MTGDLAQYGISMKEGAILAIEKFEGGGDKVELIMEDDRGNPQESASVAQKIAGRKDILGVVGPFGSPTALAAAPIYERFKMPIIAPASSAVKYNECGPYHFRVNVTSEIHVLGTAEFMKTNLKAKRVAIIYEKTDWGVGYRKALVDRFNEVGGIEIVYDDGFVRGPTTDFMAQLTKIKEANPDVLCHAALYTESALIAKQARKIGLDVVHLGNPGTHSDKLMKLGGDAVEGMIAVGEFHAAMERTEAQEFVKAYEAKYSKEPDEFVALSYDAMMILLEAIKKAGSTDHDQIRDTIAATKDFKGVTGDLSFDEKGDIPYKAVTFMVVKDGKWAYMK
jgi:branched-chain amino acid transport system substrate-binding protein